MPREEVTPETCATLRRAAKRGAAVDDLADRYRLPRETVKRHVWDRCSHEIREPPIPIE